MYRMLRFPLAAQSLGKDAPAGLGALILAEFFYKFHSFTLELGGFLLTWYLLSWLLQKIPAMAGAGSKAGQ